MVPFQSKMAELREAIEFCKAYSEERKWCIRHGLKLKKIPQEKKFQTHLLKY